MKRPDAGRVADGALLALAFVLPLSIAASEILLGVAVVAWLAGRPWRTPRPPAWRALVVTTVALAGSWLLSSAFAVDPWASLVQARRLWSIVLVLIVADRAREEGFVAKLVRAAVAGGVVSAGLGLGGVILDRITGAPPDWRMRGVFSTAMTTGNVYAILALVALAILGFRGHRPLSRAGAGVSFAVLGLGLYRTFTRSSWLAFVAGAIVLLGRTRPRWLLAGVVAATLVLAFGPPEILERVRSIGDPTYVTNQGRVSLWKSGWAVVGDHPWTGVGLADHYDLIERYRRADATFHAGHFHNNLVQIAASTGWIGFAAWAAWMGLLLFLLGRALAGPGGRWALVGLATGAAFHVSGLFDWTFGDAEVALQFYLWTGLGLAPYARIAAEFAVVGAGAPGLPDPLSATPVRPLSGPSPAA